MNNAPKINQALIAQSILEENEQDRVTWKTTSIPRKHPEWYTSTGGRAKANWNLGILPRHP